MASLFNVTGSVEWVISLYIHLERITQLARLVVTPKTIYTIHFLLFSDNKRVAYEFIREKRKKMERKEYGAREI